MRVVRVQVRVRALVPVLVLVPRQLAPQMHRPQLLRL